MASLKNNPEVLALVAEAKLKAEATAYKAAIKAIKAAQAPLLLAGNDWHTKSEVKAATTSTKAAVAAAVAAVQELTAAY